MNLKFIIFLSGSFLSISMRMNHQILGLKSTHLETTSFQGRN